jgi:hypothetical protein
MLTLLAALAVLAAAGAMWMAPVIIAAIRGTENIMLVVLLTVIAVAWPAALAAAFMLPRARPARMAATAAPRAVPWP